MCHDNEESCKNWRGIDLSFQNWHKEFDKFWPEHWKISKICTLIGCFCPKYIMFELKKYRGVMFDGTKYWCKIWWKSELCFQKSHEEFSKFSTEPVRQSKNWEFYWVLLSKIENVRALDLKGSYVSWQWRIMQNLKRNWLISLKLTWGICWILTQALQNLKNLHSNGLFFTKVYNFWAKEVQGVMFYGTEYWCKFWGKTAFKHDMRNLAIFQQSTFW